jgi:hypothetical protein
MRQFAAVPPVGFDPVAVLSGNQTWRGNQTGDAMSHQAVMKPEPKISGFIDRLKLKARISSQHALQSFPVPRNAGAKQLYLKRPDGYMPPVLMQVDPDK